MVSITFRTENHLSTSKYFANNISELLMIHRERPRDQCVEMYSHHTGIPKMGAENFAPELTALLRSYDRVIPARALVKPGVEGSPPDSPLVNG
jgi:hypothetical protein